MEVTDEKKKLLASDLAQAVGMAIKLRRTELRMTLTDVSEATGITRAALCRIENGETDMKLSTLALLRSALGFEVAIRKVSYTPEEPPMEPDEE